MTFLDLAERLWRQFPFLNLMRASKAFQFLTRPRFLVTAGVVSVIAVPSLLLNPSNLFKSTQPPPSKNQFKRSQVREHDSKEKRIWVTYENKVYDITEFVEIHPGGTKILLAAGKAIDPFWALFSIHQSAETKQLLTEYYIGDLIPIEQDDSPVYTETGLDQLFSNEPPRDASLKILAQRPFNAEAAMTSLKSFITENKHFYVRHHLPVPLIDSKDYKLEIEIPGKKPIELSLDELKKLPKTTVMVTLQCAGNRRKEMHEVRPVKGLQWQNGAISNANWTGVLLTDVLKHVGYKIDPSLDVFPGDVEQVHFDGLDGYGASVPCSKAFNPRGDVVLAYEMNGETLPVDHGYPVRAVIGGHVAARSVKWVNKITLDKEESNSHWQQKDYRGFNPSKTLQTSDYETSTSIQELPVQSSIINTDFNEKNGETILEGYAISGGGRSIVRVDVSIDGGKNWVDADLRKPEQAKDKTWAWTKWQLKVDTKGKRDLNVVCKAVDDSYNTQPDSFEGVYNARGVLSSAWQKINARVQR
jgi:sulfite oxidase